MRRLILLAVAVAMLCTPVRGQELSANWAELTASDFERAIQRSAGTCALPFGIVEKHGPTGPLGTDLINVRYSTAQAVKQEYVLSFPSTTSARSRRRVTSQAPSPTAPDCSSSYCRRPWPKWHGTDAGR